LDQKLILKILEENLMKHQIQNKNYSVQINEIGAELCSFISKETGLEHVWQGKEEYWASTAPVLFPIIGALKNSKYTYNSKSYSVPKHGFIRYNENLKVTEKSDSHVTLEYSSTEKSKLDYPFDFTFEISFSLHENKLDVSHKITNTGNSPMLFSLGGHPAFNCPLFPNEKYADYYLEFDSVQTIETTVLSKNGLQTDEKFEVVNNGKILPLNEELFANDALIFKDIKSKKVALKSKNHSHSVTVKYDDFSNLGVWAKHKAPFVCIEPWLGVTDHENSSGNFDEKEGIVVLPKGEVYQAKFSIEVG